MLSRKQPRASEYKRVDSGGELARVLSEQADALARYLDEGARQAVWGLYTELVDATPKDTGRAAAGYVINDRASGEAPPEGDYTGRLEEIAAANRRRLENIPPGGPFVVSNNLDYLDALENGHSRQAPGGFAALAERNFALALEALASGKK